MAKQRKARITPTAADLAASAVFGNREDNYGHPAEDFARIALGFTMVLSGKLAEAVTPEEVALCLEQVKVSRRCATPDREDSTVDAIGYNLCYERVVKHRNGSAPYADMPPVLQTQYE